MAELMVVLCTLLQILSFMNKLSHDSGCMAMRVINCETTHVYLHKQS